MMTRVNFNTQTMFGLPAAVDPTLLKDKSSLRVCALLGANPAVPSQVAKDCILHKNYTPELRADAASIPMRLVEEEGRKICSKYVDIPAEPHSLNVIFPPYREADPCCYPACATAPSTCASVCAEQSLSAFLEVS